MSKPNYGILVAFGLAVLGVVAGVLFFPAQNTDNESQEDHAAMMRRKKAEKAAQRKAELENIDDQPIEVVNNDESNGDKETDQDKQ